MPKNTYFIKDNIPKIEEVREIKNEIPTYEEFMKDYKVDELVENSYQAEHEAKISHGPQYGPGRSDFSGLCRRIKNDLGDNLICKISCDSDYFYSWKNYAGVIVYAVDGKFNWDVSSGRGCSHRPGHRGKSFSLFIKCTDDLVSHPGSGGFHASIIKDKFGFDLGYNNNVVCCGGFAWVPSRSESLSFNSYALNSMDQVGCSSDGSNELSYYEKRLVRYCFQKYKELGPDSVFEIPSHYLP